MAISGNKGEWSEIYTLFRLLGDGKVHAGDAHLNKMDLYYPILNVIREESKRYEYKPNTQKNIVVIDEDGNEFTRFPMDRFISESKELLKEINNSGDRAFEIPRTEKFMREVGCTKLKAPSNDKADIHIVIHDLRTNMTPLLGFSIKSQLGSPSTLLNASRATNISYRVVNVSLTDDEVAEINAIKGHLPRINAIMAKGARFEYSTIAHPVFRNNLVFIDCRLPEFMAQCLLVHSLSNKSSVKDCVEEVASINPFAFEGSNVKEFYAHKMKNLLLDAALGMTPATEWTGRYDANGGYLVVRRDGEIVCYHFYDRNDVEDYLYNNTRFERASRSRYQFGSLYRDCNGELYFKLNLQIRFKR